VGGVFGKLDFLPRNANFERNVLVNQTGILQDSVTCVSANSLQPHLQLVAGVLPRGKWAKGSVLSGSVVAVCIKLLSGCVHRSDSWYNSPLPHHS
jgi:hypothetical protein